MTNAHEKTGKRIYVATILARISGEGASDDFVGRWIDAVDVVIV